MDTYRVTLQQELKPIDGNPHRKVWMMVWHAKGKRQRRVIGDVEVLSPTKAKKFRGEHEAKLNMGTIRADKPNSILLKTFLDDDRAAYAVYSKPQSVTTHFRSSKKVLSILGEGVKLAKVDRMSVERIRRVMRSEQGLSLAYVNGTLSTMRGAFKRAIDRGLIEKNPFTGSLLGKSQAEPPRVFLDAEIAAMLEAAPDVWWRTFIVLGYTTGLRLGELLNLTWDDVDIEAKTVKVQAKRASNKQRELLEFSCKSCEDRQVPLTPAAAKLIQELRIEMGLSPYLFLSLKRLAKLRATYPAGREIEPAKLVNNYLRTFKAIQVAAGITKLGSVHNLRASYGTHTAGCVPMHELRRLMGHADISTTANFYLAPSDDTAQAVRDVFADVG